MTSRTPFLFLIATLIIIGTGSIYYRHNDMGIPLSAGEQIDIWQIEATIEFSARNNAVNAKLTLPQDPNFELVDEFTASPAYGVQVLRNGESAQAIWSKREAIGKQTLYYQASYKQSKNQQPQLPPTGDVIADLLPEPYQTSAKILADMAFEKSGNNSFYVLQVMDLLNSENQNVILLNSKYSKTEIFVHLMKTMKIHAYPVKGLILENSRRNQQLVPMVKLFIKDKWQVFNVENNSFNVDFPIIVWQENSPALLDLEGGINSKVLFAISHRTESALIEAKTSALKDDYLDLGLYSLPLAEQNMFKGILLLPIGALVVVFLRVMVGLKCSGTFMPILIATSFIQTELVNGLVGFVLIVSIGLLIRSYLSKLNLLLVSRISTVVIVVIGIIVLSTVLAFRLGLTEALTITFFPMIIMAWTIERMSILWEEEGGKEVFIQGGGSLLVAVIAYLLMDNALIRHWVFNFLGVHLLIMAAILLMGQYTGYRLLELRRFKPMAED